VGFGGTFPILLLGEAILLLAVAGLAFWNFRTIRLVRKAGVHEATRIMERHEEILAKVQAQVTEVERELEEVQRKLDRCFQRMGFIRYDAFQEMGGQLSFSLALLNGHQDGIVLSVLNGREDSRVYAKPITGGRSPSPLSGEERAALERAES
jgi:tetrahydromethanopterin S-methyltransferase subunit G